jgi:hypothetical protein
MSINRLLFAIYYLVYFITAKTQHHYLGDFGGVMKPELGEYDSNQAEVYFDRGHADLFINS